MLLRKHITRLSGYIMMLFQYSLLIREFLDTENFDIWWLTPD